jgi:hypothetical protein
MVGMVVEVGMEAMGGLVVREDMVRGGIMARAHCQAVAVMVVLVGMVVREGLVVLVVLQERGEMVAMLDLVVLVCCKVLTRLSLCWWMQTACVALPG